MEIIMNEAEVIIIKILGIIRVLMGIMAVQTFKNNSIQIKMLIRDICKILIKNSKAKIQRN